MYDFTKPTNGDRAWISVKCLSLIRTSKEIREINNLSPSLRFTSPRIVSGVFSYGSSANLKPKFSFTLVFVDLMLLALLNDWKACEHDAHNATSKAMKILDIVFVNIYKELITTTEPPCDGTCCNSGDFDR